MNNQNSNSVVPNNSTTTDNISQTIADQLEEYLDEYHRYFEVGGVNTITINGDDEEYEIMVRQCSCGEIELVYTYTGDPMGSGRETMLCTSKSVEEFLEDNFPKDE